MTPTKKGWGVRALEKIPARCFVFEYVGEVYFLTQTIVILCLYLNTQASVIMTFSNRILMMTSAAGCN